MHGDDLRYGALFNPKYRKIYAYGARRELARQFVTETFNESAEPLCWYPEPEDHNATFTETDEICLNDTDPDGTYDEDEDAVLNGCGFEVD